MYDTSNLKVETYGEYFQPIFEKYGDELTKNIFYIYGDKYQERMIEILEFALDQLFYSSDTYIERIDEKEIKVSMDYGDIEVVNIGSNEKMKLYGMIGILYITFDDKYIDIKPMFTRGVFSDKEYYGIIHPHCRPVRNIVVDGDSDDIEDFIDSPETYSPENDYLEVEICKGNSHLAKLSDRNYPIPMIIVDILWALRDFATIEDTVVGSVYYSIRDEKSRIDDPISMYKALAKLPKRERRTKDIMLSSIKTLRLHKYSINAMYSRIETSVNDYRLREVIDIMNDNSMISTPVEHFYGEYEITKASDNISIEKKIAMNKTEMEIPSMGDNIGIAEIEIKDVRIVISIPKVDIYNIKVGDIIDPQYKNDYSINTGTFKMFAASGAATIYKKGKAYFAVNAYLLVMNKKVVIAEISDYMVFIDTNYLNYIKNKKNVIHNITKDSYPKTVVVNDINTIHYVQ